MLADSGRIDRPADPWSTRPVSGMERDDDAAADPVAGPSESPAAGASFGPSGKSLAVVQEESNWCWAAAVQMLRRHVKLPERRQCEIVEQQLGKPCCESPDRCNVPLPLDRISALLMGNGLASRRERGQLDKERLLGELFERRPVLLAEVFANGTDGHVRVAFGWQQLSSGALVVRVADPARAKTEPTRPTIESISFEALQRSLWRETWHRIEVLDGTR